MITAAAQQSAPPQTAAQIAAAQQSGPPQTAAQIAAARRKSNCVKEVERIQKRRDERRAAHQAIRETVETEIDTTRPHWEFELMIM